MTKEYEVWFKYECPECKRTNWIYMSREPEVDLSKLDVDGFRCWSCGAETWLDEDKDFQEFMIDGAEKV